MCRLYEGAVASRALDGATGPVDNGPMGYRDRQFWQPDVTVATVAVREGKLLCVEERVNGHTVINQPAGHLEPDESLVDAALRETSEETGWPHAIVAYADFGADDVRSALPDDDLENAQVLVVSPAVKDRAGIEHAVRGFEREDEKAPIERKTSSKSWRGLPS